MTKLPSTNLLVSFDAAARHMSFKRAAQELFVSSAAVSHQVRTLEATLGVRLFHRHHRRIELTQTGQHYFEQISPALRTLHSATLSLVKSTPAKLVVHSIPYLTNTLLAPHLKTFKLSYPNLPIDIESKIERAKLFEQSRDALHVALRYGVIEHDGLCHDHICDVHASAVCAPGYDFTSPCTQIVLSTDNFSWKTWNQEWGVSLMFEDTISSDSYQSVIHMAQQGLGVTMGYLPFISNEITTGSLTFVAPDTLSALGSVYLVYRHQDRNNEILRDFRQWLHGVFQSTD